MADHRSVDLLLIGVDACCRRVVDPLIDEGCIPHIESLLEGGASGTLTSQIPPWTASAWPTLYTGVNPGKHGVFDFLTYDGYDWGVVDAQDVREFAIWELLDRHDKRSVVVNVPVTHPPGPFDGALLPGFTAPEEPTCYPPELLEEVREAIGGYRVYPTPGDDEAVFPEYLECVEMRGEAFRYLADRFQPDFGFLQFQATDTVFHQYSHEDQDRIRAVYEAVDEQIGRTIEATDPELVLLVSDHGLGPYEGVEFRINEWLGDRGYLERQRGGTGMPSWQVARDDQLRQGEEATQRELSALERVVATASRVGLTTTRIRKLLEVVRLDTLVRAHAPTGVVRASERQVDFPSSRAYMRSRVETGVRINLQGRDPNGQVAPSEYEPLRDELIDQLSGVTTPEGDPVFEDVVRVEDHFNGPYVDEGVDLLTIPDGWNHFLSAQLPGEPFGSPAEPWNHKLDGVIGAAGKGVDPETPLSDAHLHDVAPTVLAALDVPVNERMDGEVLPIVEPTPTRPYPEYEATASADAREADIEDRLAALGYIE